jgi:hypothetical protein
MNVGKVGKYARVVAAHHADADHANAQPAIRAHFRGLHHDEGGPSRDPMLDSSLARVRRSGDAKVFGAVHVLHQSITPKSPAILCKALI